MKNKATTERLIEQYNTLTRRPTIADLHQRALLFRAFERTLGSVLPARHSARILDIGCGEGTFLAFLQSRGYTDLSGFDLSPQNVAICHQLGLNFVTQGDALHLEALPVEGFEAIFALDLLEHLPKESAASFLEHVRRLLKPGGYAVIQTPNMGSLAGLYVRYNDLSHEFGLTENTARSLCALAGFSFEHITVQPCWNATTLLGYWREYYLRFLHAIIFFAEGDGRPRIPTKNLIIRVLKSPLERQGHIP